MSSRWLTCPRWRFQFEHAAGTPRICPRCGYGEGHQPRPRPRSTGQLPPQNPYPPPAPKARSGRRGRRQLPPFSSYSKPIQITTIVIVAGVLLLCLACGISIFTTGSQNTSAQPTSAIVAQGQNPQATSTKASASATDTPVPAAAADTPVSCAHEAVNGNPWCFTFYDTGNLIYDPPAGFCGVFPCISSFENGSGYVVECNDGDYSKSGGKSGVCSSEHGGFQRNLFMP